MKAPNPFALAIALALALPGIPAAAQSAGDGYLFHPPVATIGLRGGYSAATAGSDVFDDVTRQLTLNKGDFGSLTVGADIGFRVTSKLDITVDAGYSRSSHKSEFRDFVDNNDLPIEQTTTFERIPLTANLRINLGTPGRSIGSLAWIPSRVVPYVGAGVGAMRYRFKQDGDFVNFNTNAVFPAVLDSDGWALVGQAMAGVDYNFSTQFGLSFDARYLHAKGELGSSFKGYEKIDLSGATATVGLLFRL